MKSLNNKVLNTVVLTEELLALGAGAGAVVGHHADPVEGVGDEPHDRGVARRPKVQTDDVVRLVVRLAPVLDLSTREVKPSNMDAFTKVQKELNWFYAST